MMRLAAYFGPIIGRLANAARAPSRTFDREDLKLGDECAVLSQQVSDLKRQNYELRKKLVATTPTIYRERGRSAP
jgi:hypothetical protein